jgi:hypothetical protein
MAQISRTQHDALARFFSAISPFDLRWRYPLLGPDFDRLDRTSLRLAHLFNHLISAQ